MATPHAEAPSVIKEKPQLPPSPNGNGVSTTDIVTGYVFCASFRVVVTSLLW